MKKYIQTALAFSLVLSAAAQAQPNIAWFNTQNDVLSVYVSDGVSSKLLAANTTGFLTVTASKVYYTGSERAIYEFNGSRSKMVATSGTFDLSKSADGNNLVYSETSSTDGLVKLYDGSSSKTIWSSGSPLLNPSDVKISGKTIVWRTQAHADNGYGHDLFIFDGSKVSNLNLLTNTSRDFQQAYDVSGNTVVWGHDNYAGTIAYIDIWDGKTHQTLKSNEYLYRQPKVSGTNVAFIGNKGSLYEIFMWDGKTTRQLTQSGFYKTSLELSGNTATWLGQEGDKIYTYVWDGAKVIKLLPGTSEFHPTLKPQIANGQVVWQANIGGAYQVFFWDGKTTRQLSNGGANIAPVIANTAGPTPNPAPIQDGRYLIKNVYSGKYLNRAGSSTANGSRIQQWECDSCLDNKWQVSSLGDGSYKITAVNASDQGLDVNGTADGAYLQMWTYWGGGDNQKFLFNKTASGYYTISPKSAPGKALEVKAGQVNNGAGVFDQSLSNSSNQHWVFVPVN